MLSGRLAASSGRAKGEPVDPPVSPAHVARAYAPVMRWVLGAAGCYYAIIAASHPFAETGSTALVLTALAAAASIWSVLAWRRLRRPPEVSLGWLEVVAAITYGLYFLNVLAHQTLSFRPERLVYFVFLAMIFGITAPSQRVAYVSIGVALAGMVAVGLRSGLQFLEVNAFVGIAGAFAAVGMAKILRGMVMREIQARTLSETLLAEAQSAVRAKSAFLATISHEFRTPLNAILGMAQVMQGDKLPRRQVERLDVVQRDADALRQLLDDTLDIIALQADDVQPRADAFDLERFAEGLERLYRSRIAAKGLSLSIQVRDAGPGRCVTDESRLRQVAANLISNAIKFTPSGTIVLSLEAGADELVLRVDDTGIGIPQAAQAHIFEPFTQVDDAITRTAGGTGLGLAICQQTVNLLGGAIDVESAPGLGARFTVRLPITRQVGDDMDDAAAPGIDGRRRALLVDDNSTNLLVLQALLESLGVECALAQNGLQAIDACREREFDVVFMDIHMPHMDGMTATRVIRDQQAERGLAPTPIFAVTASVLPEDIARYGAAGMDGVIAKPISLSELAAALQSVHPRTASASDDQVGTLLAS